MSDMPYTKQDVIASGRKAAQEYKNIFSSTGPNMYDKFGEAVAEMLVTCLHYTLKTIDYEKNTQEGSKVVSIKQGKKAPKKDV